MKVEILKKSMKWSDGTSRTAKKGDVIELDDVIAGCWIKLGYCKKPVAKKTAKS
jgi:hypothetical protein